MLNKQFHSLHHIGIFVADLERSREFYEKHLGMQLVEQSEDDSAWMMTLQAGDQEVHLFQAKDTAARPHINHLAYWIDPEDLDPTMKDLTRRGIAFTGPHRYRNTVFIKFQDLDGITWECICQDAEEPGDAGCD